jgi:hypothetical protein
MATLSNFGEQFASSVIKKVQNNAVYPAITNRDYEGEIKKPGDRVNILSFLNDILLGDYAVGSDMNSETIVDAEDQLVVEKRKYFNFSLDRLEDLFTYGGDIPEALLLNASQVLEREMDRYVLEKAVDARAGNWVGVDLVVYGSGQTMASIVTTATGGTVTLHAPNNTYEGSVGSAENPRDGAIYFAGFHATDVGKGFRLRSTAAYVTPWYRISSVTNTTTATLTEWDGATSGSDFEEGYTLRGTFGGDGRTFTKGATGDSLIGQSGLGWEIQAAIATAVSAGSIYDQVTLLAEALDAGEVPQEGRKLTVTENIITQLKQASELQPTGISEIYTGTVLNGRVMRVGGFDVHSAAGARVSSRAGHPTSTSGPGSDIVVSTGSTGYFLIANHPAFMTFAEKWSESRVVDAENQFAKKYQGLYLWGALVPAYRRKFGAVLFGSF